MAGFIGETLARLRPNWRPDVPIEDLVELEPTVELERRLDAAYERLGHLLMRQAEFGADDKPTRQIRDADATIAASLGRVRLGRRRDLLELAYGCWCLGLGGRGPRPAYVPKLGVLDVDGVLVETLAKYCDCPIGAELAADHRRLVELGMRQAEAVRLSRIWRGVPEELRNVRLETYPTDTEGQRFAVGMVTDWTQYRTPWLWLFGAAGVGKSGLAIAAALASGQVWAFVTVPDLLARIRATYDRDARNRDISGEADVLDTAYNVELLVLDDLGAQPSTDWADGVLYQVIYHRHAERRRTIVTSNKGPDSIEAKLGDQGERVLSRILGAAADFVVRVDGPDLRQRWEGR